MTNFDWGLFTELLGATIANQNLSQKIMEDLKTLRFQLIVLKNHDEERKYIESQIEQTQIRIKDNLQKHNPR